MDHCLSASLSALTVNAQSDAIWRLPCQNQKLFLLSGVSGDLNTRPDSEKTEMMRQNLSIFPDAYVSLTSRKSLVTGWSAGGLWRTGTGWGGVV